MNNMEKLQGRYGKAVAEGKQEKRIISKRAEFKLTDPREKNTHSTEHKNKPKTKHKGIN